MRSPLENTASENPWCLNACSEPPKRVAKTEWLGQGVGMQGRAGMCIFRGVVVMKMLEPPRRTCPLSAGVLAGAGRVGRGCSQTAGVLSTLVGPWGTEKLPQGRCQAICNTS